eukprot:m.77549 g.77549  ORF g.77549 m.77549 type:complete len:578 (+) comp11920_c0_seq1:151-1884(+)
MSSETKTNTRRRRARGLSAPVRMKWSVKFEAPTSDETPHVSVHKGKYPDALIDHFSIGYTIGDGGFSKVKLARHRATGIKVAIKIVNKDTLMKKNELFRAANEIASLQLLKHQNITKLFMALENEEKVYMVMEHLPAGELFDYIVAQGRLQEDVARELFRQVVAGVAYCHSEGFTHRDLKPENMLFDENKTLKLIDFGLVSMPGNDVSSTSCGSANYAAPEVIRGSEYFSTAADMWSLGVVLYAMLCGFLPFDDPDLRILGSMIKKGKYSEPKWLSDQAASLIRDLLKVNAEERITMKELLEHPWVTKGLSGSRLQYASTIMPSLLLDEQIIDILAKYYGKPAKEIRDHLKTEPCDHVSADYDLFCTAKTKKLPIHLTENSGKYCPRLVPNIENEIEQIEAEKKKEEEALLATEEVETKKEVSKPRSVQRGRRRGMSEAPKPKFNMDGDDGGKNILAPADAGWMGKFNSLRALAQPHIVHKGNLGINYKTETDAETVRGALLMHLQNLPAQTKVKNRMYRLDVQMQNELSDNDDIRLHFEIVKIVEPPSTGIRVTRVKGERQSVQLACTRIFDTFNV